MTIWRSFWASFSSILAKGTGSSRFVKVSVSCTRNSENRCIWRPKTSQKWRRIASKNHLQIHVDFESILWSFWGPFWSQNRPKNDTKIGIDFWSISGRLRDTWQWQNCALRGPPRILFHSIQNRRFFESAILKEPKVWGNREQRKSADALTRPGPEARRI